MADKELTDEIKQEIEGYYNRYYELREQSIYGCYTFYKDGVELTGDKMDIYENGVYNETYDSLSRSKSEECENLAKEMNDVWWKYIWTADKYNYWNYNGVWGPLGSGNVDENGESTGSVAYAGVYLAEVTEGEIVPNIKEIFEEIFKDFTYDNANMAGGEVLLSREEVETASYWKVAAIGKLNESRFVGNVSTKLTEGMEKDFETLAEAKAYLESLAKYLKDGNGLKNEIVEALKELIEFYKDVTKKYSEIAIYSSKCDYMTHQYHEDESAWEVLESWVPDVQVIMQTVEDSVPEVVEQQKDELVEIIEQVQEVAEKLKENDAVELLETLKGEVEVQYLSRYIDYYGTRLAQIIRSIYSGVDNKNYDIDLIDELTIIEQKLQQQLMTAASRMTILNKSVQNYKAIGEFSSSNADIVARLRDAVLGLTEHNSNVN